MAGDYGEPNTINQLPNPKWERAELEPRRGLVLFPWWVWPLVILGVVVIVGGTWIAVIRPSGKGKAAVVATATATRPLGAFATSTRASTGLASAPATPATPVAPSKAATVLSATPVATAAPPTPSGQLQIGAKAVVKGVGAAGLNVRASPSLSGKQVMLAKEGQVFAIVDGPQSADGYQWWKVQDQAGTVGWAAATYLAPQ